MGNDVTAVLTAFYDAFNAGDADGVVATLDDQQLVMIGTDPAEYWDSPAAVEKALRAQITELGGVQFASGEVTADHDGDVGWFADQPTITLPDGATVAFRLTGVARRRGDGWKIVQAHLSVGAANEEVVGKELTV